MKAAKRALDILLAAAALLALAPILAAATLAVKLTSPGPVFYRQARAGRLGRPFRVFKFRSMYTGAADLRNPDGSAWTGTDDPRVTPIGRFLRETSIDELPQLFNVLLGDMSLVGPRPDQADQILLYAPAEKRRLDVRPGITGLAQISGRNGISWAERKKLDVEYVERWTLALDLSILCKTVPYVVLRKGIHTSPRRRETA